MKDIEFEFDFVVLVVRVLEVIGSNKLSTICINGLNDNTDILWMLIITIAPGTLYNRIQKMLIPYITSMLLTISILPIHYCYIPFFGS